MIDEAVRRRLLDMAEADLATRTRLAADGSLFDGYHPEMQAVHEANAAVLAEIIDRHGWPSAELAGGDGAEAAWLIAQHAIGLPDFQRRCLAAIHAFGPKWQAVYLEDRIRTLEGRPQLYGTQFDWDDDGEMSPLPIEQPETVDVRRAAIGLSPLADKAAQIRRDAASERCPADIAAYRREADAWAHRVGWRKV